MNKSILPVIFILHLGIVLLSCSEDKKDIDQYDADVIISWNEKIFELAIEEDNLLTLKGVRTAAMMHTAMHDALNRIIPEYTCYANNGKQINADPLAAVNYAAYEIAISQYPDKNVELESELNRWLKEIKNKNGIDAGKYLGKESASSIMDQRSNDHWDTAAEYTWHPMAPGVYAEFRDHSGTPEGFVFGAGWAKAEPFLLPAQDHFRSPPPPAINSDDYSTAFNEVKDVGAFESNRRTKDQAHMAMWWKDFVENSHNRLARKLVKTETLNLWEASRVFALMNMAIYDAYVSVFDNKFYYNHWRPYTAIRWADKDGNPDTELDVDWNNLHHHTYAFPSYPSAHGCASGAAMTILSKTLGTGNEYHFTMVTEEVDKAGPLSEKINMEPSTRSFNSFSDAGMEAAMSRLYLGIHFRYDSEQGYNLGKMIGEYANKNFLTPVNETE